MGTAHRIAGLLTLVCTLVAAVGCSPSATESGEAPATSADSPVPIDLAGLAALARGFPPDFLVKMGEVGQQDAADVGLVGAMVSAGKPFTVDPPQCRALLNPVVGIVGADYVGIRADGPGPDEQTVVVTVYDRVTIPVAWPSMGCERMAFDVNGGTVRGTAERLPAPDIAGAATAAVKIDHGAGAPWQYSLLAVLDGGGYVQLDARTGPTTAIQRQLPDLLTKAVGAIRDPGAPSTSVRRTGGAGQVDVARLSELADQFPPGFVVPPFEPGVTTQQFVEQVGAAVSSGRSISVDPPQCRVLLKPVEGRAGADHNGTRASGVGKQWISVGVDSPVTTTTPIPTVGCDQMPFSSAGDGRPRSVGAAERIAAPRVDTATTLALRITVDGYSQIDYSYVAILDGGALVGVYARLNPNAPEAELLSSLLLKAVDAVRGD